jgi:hypothetical protein
MMAAPKPNHGECEMNVHVDFAASTKRQPSINHTKRKLGAFEQLSQRHQRARKALASTLWLANDHPATLPLASVQLHEIHFIDDSYCPCLHSHEEIDATSERYIAESQSRGYWSDCHPGASESASNNQGPAFTDATLEEFREVIRRYHDALDHSILAAFRKNSANGHYDARARYSAAVSREAAAWEALKNYVLHKATPAEVVIFGHYVVAAAKNDLSFHRKEEAARDTVIRRLPQPSLIGILQFAMARQTAGFVVIQKALKRLARNRLTH